jgi:transglutaminase-like putative cysteine protease
MSPEREDAFRRLAWTTAGLAAALGPHLLRLQPWISALVFAIAAWRLLAERRGWRMPGKLLRATIAAAATVGVFLGYSTIAGLDGGTALLALMSALKLLETKGPRDHAVLIFIGFFLCLAAFLYAQDMGTAAWVLPTLWLLAAALLSVARRGSGGPPLRPFRTTGAMLLKAAPVALVLFLFFPRVEGSYWGAPSSERAVTGLSDEMSPGDISELTLNDVIAFRVRFRGEPPPPVQRYWRGFVLSATDGNSWSRPDSQFLPRDRVTHAGPPVDYTVTLEPTGQQVLFALEMPGGWTPGIANQSADLGLRTRRPVNAVLQYDVRSWPRYRAGDTLKVTTRDANLELPRGRNPRAVELAVRMRSEAGSDAAFVRAVLDRFRTQDYYYTLTPPGLGRESVDDFLFNTRRGFCGHYASAFTTLMRAAGIPARVVAGYQGGDWNPIGGYLIVRQSHAHAWSEVWLDGEGWKRVDPTAAVAPGRVERGLDATFAGSELLPRLNLADSPFLWRASMAWDSVNAEWNDWVVKFDRATQENMFADMGIGNPGWRAFAGALGIGLTAAIALVFAWLAFDFRPARRDPASAAYRRFVSRLARRGIEAAVGEAPRDFAQRVRYLRPELGLAARSITECYLRLRYGPAPAAADLDLLRREVARFRP